MTDRFSNLSEDELSKLMQEVGRRGGKTTSEKYGADHYRRMQAKGVQTRLKNKALLQRTTSK